MESLLRTRSGRWLLFILGWVTLSLLFAPEAYLSFYLRHSPMSWRETLQITVINSAIALLFIPGIVFLARRFPLERRTWRVALAVHIPACLAFSVLHSLLYAMACHAWQGVVGATLYYRFHPNLLTYWAIVGATQAFDYFRKYQEREREITRLSLEMLKAQMQPHFLFNSLHTISAMMHVDVKRADRMLSRLSSLLRMTLGNIGRQEVRLADEIAFVEAYLDIERERFGERLELRIEVAHEALDALVPALFLQPLVENSVRHGFAAPAEDGIISIGAARDGERLFLTVTDNGRGLSGAQPREGVGITNTRARLKQLYGADHEFDIEACASSGVLVTVAIPFHLARELELPTEVVSDGHKDLDSGRRALGANPHRVPARH
jgi:two-component system, LytTR family, sensor kinase